jgi:hypothetical protein
MTNDELLDYLTGNLGIHTLVELTDDLMVEIVRNKEWGSVESLKEMRDEGFKWNTQRKSCMMPPEPI